MTALTPAERILKSLGIEAPGEIDLEAIAWTRASANSLQRTHVSESAIISARLLECVHPSESFSGSSPHWYSWRMLVLAVGEQRPTLSGIEGTFLKGINWHVLQMLAILNEF